MVGVNGRSYLVIYFNRFFMKMVIDIETQNSFQDVGSRARPDLLKVSVVVVYWYPDDKYYTFGEDEMEKLENLFSQTETVIGFNTISFDLPVLQQYMKKINLLSKKQVDMMVEVEKVLGYKIPLNSVARATLNNKKSSSGLEAIKMWRQGRLSELKAYCEQDVKLTKEIYEYGVKNKMIKFYAGWEEYEVPVEWK